LIEEAIMIKKLQNMDKEKIKAFKGMLNIALIGNQLGKVRFSWI